MGETIRIRLHQLWHSLVCGCRREQNTCLWRGWSRLIFPLMSAAALAWFLCRVIPKPIRATYPCQRAAFPLATTFVIWLLGVKTGLFVWLKWRERSRQLRPVLVAGLMACLLASVAWAATQAVSALVGFNSSPAPKAASAWAPTDPPNSPIGQGKGIFPGRVTWIRDTNATPWKGAGSGYWWHSTNINQAALDKMMSRSLRGVTGTTNDAQAWDLLFRHYNTNRARGNFGYRTNEAIAVKVNLNNTYGGYTDADNDIDQSPQSIRSLLNQLVNQAGVPPDRITIYDASPNGNNRAIPDRIYTPLHAEFPGVHWVDCRGLNGREAPNWTPGIKYSSSIAACGTNLPACVVNATYLINFGLLKGHEISGITLAAKNHFGSIQYPGSDHGKYVKPSAQAMGAYSAYADFLGSTNLGGKTILSILDGLYGTRTNVKGVEDKDRWTNLFNGQWSASYLMSVDAVALDSVGLDFLRAEFDNTLGYSGNASFPMGAITNCDNYLHEAAKGTNTSFGAYRPDGIVMGSVGVHEHWNNAVEKNYSRNLNPTASGIELLVVHELVKVTLVTPTNGTSLRYGTNVTIQATASTNDSRIQRMDFFANGSLLGSVSNAPWAMTWTNPPLGNWSLTATATDVGGDSYSSDPANLSVWLTDLRVTLVNPTNGAQFAEGTNIQIEATAASTNTTVAQVAFYRNGAWLGRATNAPYRVIWSNASAGFAALTAVATGTDGVSATSTVVTVSIRPPGLAIAGTLHVDVRAPDFIAGASTWTNRGALGHFTKVNNPALVGDVLGTGLAGVQFNGTSDAFIGPNSVADIDGAGSRSFEAWVFNPAIATEETLLEIGHRNTLGRNCAFNYGTHLTWGACAQWGTYDIGWIDTTNIPPAGAWHHLVYTYDGTTNCCIYVDGALRITKGLPGALSTFAGEPILLGAQRGNTANSAPANYFFSGYLNSVRVHGGVLTSNDVAANYAFGPTVPDGPASIAAHPQDTAALEGGRAVFTAQVTGAQPIGYQWLRNGTPIPSANTAALTLTNVSWSDHGATFQMTASNFAGGLPCTATSAVARLTVLAAGDTLTHRWSFTSNANDSIGTAHGTLQGAAALSGGRVALNGTVGTYVNLPGGLIAGYRAVTFEFWASFGANGNWVRVFEMGKTNGTAGQSNVYFSPHSGGDDYRMTIRDPDPTERIVNITGNLDNRTNLHVVCVLDPPSGFMGFYTNGALAVSRADLASMDAVATNLFWLGRSLYAADAWLNASIDEFRIYNAALAPRHVARNFSNGPDNAPFSSIGAPPLMLSPTLTQGQLRLTWPEWAAGVGLWYATNLGPTSTWWPVSNGVIVTNGQTHLLQPAGAPQRFFRLGSP